MMTPVDAIVILSNCRDLADKLIQLGSQTFLESSEREHLVNFHTVQEAGIPLDAGLLALAGLSLAQLDALERAVALRRY